MRIISTRRIGEILYYEWIVDFCWRLSEKLRTDKYLRWKLSILLILIEIMKFYKEM